MKLKVWLAKLVKSWWFPWLVIGVAIRLLLMPITLHPDLWGHSFSAYFLAYEGKWNLYDTLASLSPTHPLVKNFGVRDIFIYPPLAYFTLGLFRVLVKPFTDPTFIPWLMENLDKVHQYPHLFRQLFWFKFPYLFFDIASAFLLAGLFDTPRHKKLAFIFWIFNPLTIYATFMMGQIDLPPTFFVILFLYLVKKNRLLAAMACLGIGGSYKMFPLLFIIVAAFVLAEKFKERIKLAIVGFLPFIIFILPYLNSPAFRSMVLFSPKSQKMLYMIFPLSGAEGVYPFILGVALFYFIAWTYSKRWPIENYFLAILLITFSVTHFHPQWFLWVTPLLIIILIKSDFKYSIQILALFFCWLIITLLFEPSLSFGLFNPLWPKLETAQGLDKFLAKYTNVFQFKSMVRSVLAAASAFLILELFAQKNNVAQHKKKTN
jgi:hypothetical protein